MAKIATPFSRTHIPTVLSDGSPDKLIPPTDEQIVEQRLDALVNRRALMVYAANILPDLSPCEAAAAGLPVDDHEAFLSRQRERFVHASVGRRALKGHPKFFVDKSWVTTAQAGWTNAANEAEGMLTFEDELLTNHYLQAETYEKVMNWQETHRDPSQTDSEGNPLDYDNLTGPQQAKLIAEGAVFLPGVDDARGINIRNLMGLIHDAHGEPAGETLAS